MRRERLEIGWYALRPFLIYMVLFITIRAILYRLLESALLSASADMVIFYDMWSAAADILIIGISSAGAAVPILGEGRREVLITRSRSRRAWITGRKDSGFLIGLLPAGTVFLCAFLNLVLSPPSPGSAAAPVAAAVPVGAAVYGILTPFVEELLFRGIVWHRLRRGFTPLESAFFSSLLFGISHENIPQGIYGFTMGMVFALSYEITRRFEVPFLLHCTCNLAVLTASAAGWGSVLTSPMWILFFAAGSAAVFGYLGHILYKSGFRL